ncbi:hypothetical protein MPER_12453 [Moniliophthora perniciosa FA553]|nr:hypothetical protein MPER_12453 [Moniliophthora perniciosa FA553]
MKYYSIATPVNVTEDSGEVLQPSSTGVSNGYFYSWFAVGTNSATYTNGPGGQYTVTWSGNVGDIVGGKGWNPGSSTRIIHYSGTYQPNGNSYFAVYGWTRNALIEYYIVESYGSYDPRGNAVKKGTVTCDGASYDVLSAWRYNEPSIDGIQTFQQFWSVRGPKKPNGSISGSVNVACHFHAWKKFGMTPGLGVPTARLGSARLGSLAAKTV